eukprot:COSAG01_NODE_6455_length_3657_cov_2.617416_4_plen_366_part_00
MTDQLRPVLLAYLGKDSFWTQCNSLIILTTWCDCRRRRRRRLATATAAVAPAAIHPPRSHPPRQTPDATSVSGRCYAFPLTLIRRMALFEVPSTVSQFGIFYTVILVVVHCATADFGHDRHITGGEPLVVEVCNTQTEELWHWCPQVLPGANVSHWSAGAAAAGAAAAAAAGGGGGGGGGSLVLNSAVDGDPDAHPTLMCATVGGGGGGGEAGARLVLEPCAGGAAPWDERRNQTFRFDTPGGSVDSSLRWGWSAHGGWNATTLCVAAATHPTGQGALTLQPCEPSLLGVHSARQQLAAAPHSEHLLHGFELAGDGKGTAAAGVQWHGPMPGQCQGSQGGSHGGGGGGGECVRPMPVPGELARHP